MAFTEFSGSLDVTPKGGFTQFEGELDGSRRQELPAGVRPSTAGAGRGSIIPPTAQEMREIEKQRTWKEAGTDTARSIAQGLIDVGGTLPGVAYGAVTGDYNNAWLNTARGMNDIIEGEKSGGIKARQQEAQDRLKLAQGWQEKFAVGAVDTLTDPALLGDMLSRSAPSMLVGGLVGRGAGAAVDTLANTAIKGASTMASPLATVGLQAAKAAPTIAGGTALGSAAAIQGSSVASDTYEEAMSKPIRFYRDQEGFAELAEKHGEQKAKSMLASQAANRAGAVATAASLAAMKLIPGGGTIEKAFLPKAVREAGELVASSGTRLLTRPLTKGFSGGAASKAGEMAVQGGVVGTKEGFSESAEEGFGAVAKALEVSQIDKTTPNLEEQFAEAAGQAFPMGMVMGGTTGAAQSRRPITAAEIAKTKGFALEPTPEESARLKSLQDAGEKSAAAIMQGRIDKRVAADSMGAEAEAMAANNPAFSTPDFQDQYKSLRVTGIKPVEAAARASVLTSFGQAAQASNLSPAALQAALQAAQGKDIADLPGFLSRYTGKLAEKGIGQAIPIEALETARDDAMETAMQSVYAPPAAADILEMEQDTLSASRPVTSEQDTPQPQAPLAPIESPLSNNKNQAQPIVEPAQDAINSVANTQDAKGGALPSTLAPIAIEPIKPPAPMLRPAEVQPEPQKAAAPKGLRIGMTPKLAEPVTVRDGEIYIGDSQAINFETGDPVKADANATSNQIILALKDAGALSRRQKIYGNEQNQEAGTQTGQIPSPAPNQEATPMASDAAGRPVEPTAAGSATVESAGVKRDTASWMIKDKATGKVVMETFDKKKVDALNTAKYEAVPIIEHYGQLNRVIKQFGEEAANKWMRGEGLPSDNGVAPNSNAQNQKPQVTRLGVNNIDITEGGKPFKTQLEAKKAKKAQHMMRVSKAPGGKGYILTEKTPAQLNADAQRAGKSPSAGKKGVPYSLHEFIASRGGLDFSADKEIGIGKNLRIGGKTLYAGKKAAAPGMTLGQASELAWQKGYFTNEPTEAEFAATVKQSLTVPRYTAEGFDRIAQAETETRFEDYMAAQAEAQNTDFDPFPLPDGYTSDIREESDYDEASAEKIQQWEALIAQAEAEGIDTESIKERFAQQENLTDEEYRAAIRAEIADQRAVRADGANPDRGEDSEQGREAAGQGRGGRGSQTDRPESAQGNEPRSVTKRSDGTLSVKGDPQEIKAELAQAGITNVIASKDGVVVGKTKADEAEAILTAPTREDILDQQDRAENAQALDDKAQIDREASGFTPQSQTQDIRKDNTSDMSGGPSVADFQAAAQRKPAGTESTEPDLSSEEPDAGQTFTLDIPLFGRVPYRAAEPAKAPEGGKVISSEILTTKTKLRADTAKDAGIPDTVYAWRVSLIQQPKELGGFELPTIYTQIEAMHRDTGRSKSGEVLAYFKPVDADIAPRAVQNRAESVFNDFVEATRNSKPAETNKNEQKTNTSAEPAQKTEKSEQVSAEQVEQSSLAETQEKAIELRKQIAQLEALKACIKG